MIKPQKKQHTNMHSRSHTHIHTHPRGFGSSVLTPEAGGLIKRWKDVETQVWYKMEQCGPACSP